jgi:hypothetical protein
MLHFMSGVVRLVVRFAGFVNAALSFSLPLHNGRERVAEWERDLREERDAWPKAAQPFRVLRTRAEAGCQQGGHACGAVGRECMRTFLRQCLRTPSVLA